MPRVIPLQKPRRFGKGYDNRKPLIAKIHVAKAQMAMEDDSYRALLVRVTGHDSCTKMNIDQLQKVVEEFGRLGFKGPTRPTKPGGLPAEEQASKIRALWLNLYHLGALDDPSEEALVVFCKRQSGVEKIEWMHSEQFDNVIRGLRGWLQRLDWENPSAQAINGVARLRAHHCIDPEPGRVNYGGVAAKAATIRAQYELIGQDMLGFVPELMPAEDMDALIETLGVKCRAIRKAGN